MLGEGSTWQRHTHTNRTRIATYPDALLKHTKINASRLIRCHKLQERRASCERVHRLTNPQCPGGQSSRCHCLFATSSRPPARDGGDHGCPPQGIPVSWQPGRAAFEDRLCLGLMRLHPFMHVRQHWQCEGRSLVVHCQGVERPLDESHDVEALGWRLRTRTDDQGRHSSETPLGNVAESDGQSPLHNKIDAARRVGLRVCLQFLLVAWQQ